ncbi:polysaccharide biosynthesis tyrosine autokinase [Sinomonas sp. JGH33]|uniref:Polysaccharide biosynthesis tyrosine autokinase n=1 Tax=Sinomonas terricola TaxID=3110330 RepID=A0ABU5T153_9MICC|nr:polysaccharide biosynthesis tyrosine autokinase [Sinomonas sp. JGH33]MEA5453393.1 polysaccharide biosynthesis tyrosine autokinase [Sinomonas sp. JGH33]
MKEEKANADRAGVAARNFWRSVRRHWVVVVASMLLGLVAGFAWTLTQAKMFTSEASGVVSTGVNENLGLALSADNLAKSKATQYKSMAESRTVAERAVKLAGLDATPAAALARVTTSVPLDTAQIKVSVSWGDPDGARLLADSWIAALGREVERVENQEVDGAGANAAGARSVIKILAFSPATAPSAPSSPNVRIAAAVGLLGGLVLSLFYAFVRGFFDRRIRSAAVIEDEFKVPVVGTIPVSEAIGSSRTIERASTRSAAATNFRINEAFKGLRTNLKFMSPDRPPRIITVTSSLPGDGKSTVADNLAIALAAGGEPVILVDGDLRRPTVAKTFSLVENVGLTDVIVGDAEVEDVIQDHADYPNLRILGAGPLPPNPSEILSSEKMHSTMRALARDHFVIIDSPPLLPVTDAAVLAARFDGALIVVSAARTKKDEFAKAVETLERVNGHVFGTVLNRIPTKKAEAAYYNYYGQSYYYSDSAERRPSARKRKGRVPRMRRRK